MLRSPFYSQSISLCICEVTALLCAFSVLIPWKMHLIILSFPLIHTQTQHTHTHTLIRWQMRHAHKRLVGIRDRAETKELIFTRKIFSLNRDLRRLRVPVSFFLVVSSTIAPFLLLLLLHRCYRSKKKLCVVHGIALKFTVHCVACHYSCRGLILLIFSSPAFICRMDIISILAYLRNSSKRALAHTTSPYHTIHSQHRSIFLMK